MGLQDLEQRRQASSESFPAWHTVGLGTGWLFVVMVAGVHPMPLRLSNLPGFCPQNDRYYILFLTTGHKNVSTISTIVRCLLRLHCKGFLSSRYHLKALQAQL